MPSQSGPMAKNAMISDPNETTISRGDDPPYPRTNTLILPLLVSNFFGEVQN
jgi:hypothetical protein